jgi:hypothetical protein
MTTPTLGSGEYALTLVRALEEAMHEFVAASLCPDCEDRECLTPCGCACHQRIAQARERVRTALRTLLDWMPV